MVAAILQLLSTFNPPCFGVLFSNSLNLIEGAPKDGFPQAEMPLQIVGFEIRFSAHEQAWARHGQDFFFQTLGKCRTRWGKDLYPRKPETTQKCGSMEKAETRLARFCICSLLIEVPLILAISLYYWRACQQQGHGLPLLKITKLTH